MQHRNFSRERRSITLLCNLVHEKGFAMCFGFHPLQYIPLLLFGLYCLKRFIDSEELFKTKVIALTLILSFIFVGLIGSGFSKYGGTGYQPCVLDFSEIEKSETQNNNSFRVCF